MAVSPARLFGGVLLGGVALAACSSAPAPVSLSGPPSQIPGTTAPGTTGGPAPTATAGPSGVPGPGGTAGGTTGGTGTTGGATGGATGAVGTTGGSTGGGSTGSVLTRSHLFSAAENTIGITPTSITMCAHAALTYGKAFNTTDADFNVFWQALNTEKGGIFGRKVSVSYENDNYDPNTAVEAATTCKSKGIFMLLGGIGFDQIPNVRNWAETNHELYLHHTATVKGSAGLKYSFTELPSVERMGEGFGQLYLSKYQGQRVGIIERDSANWKPGADAFKSELATVGITPAVDDKVADKKHNYTQEILDLKGKVDVVFLWENALNSTEFVTQAEQQGLDVHYLMFPFNLTTQTLAKAGITRHLDGVAMYPAYSFGDYSGPFASYADDMKEFEREYAKYDSGADLKGAGGDLLFLNWTAQKALAAQFYACGKDCTRNAFIDVLQAWHSVPTSSGCLIDFTHGDGHHGAERLDFMESYAAPSGVVNWRITRPCVARP